MPKKRVSSKQKRRDDVLSEPGGWLLFWAGPVYNRGFFGSMDEMKQYYFDNKTRVIHELGGTTDFWAFHAFEPHERANCAYCRQHDVEGDLCKLKS